MDNKEKILSAIQETLAQIPENHLVHLQSVIQSFYDSMLLAQKDTTSHPQEEELQTYIEQFRKTFSLIMKKNLGIQAAYDHSCEDRIVLQLTFPELDEVEEKVQPTSIALPQIIQENEYSTEEFEAELNQNKKVFLFWEDSFLIVKSADAKYWGVKMAKEDAREILDLGLKELFTTSRQKHEKSIAS